jgi:hypothetical protein
VGPLWLSALPDLDWVRLGLSVSTCGTVIRVAWGWWRRRKGGSFRQMFAQRVASLLLSRGLLELERLLRATEQAEHEIVVKQRDTYEAALRKLLTERQFLDLSVPFAPPSDGSGPSSGSIGNMPGRSSGTSRSPESGQPDSFSVTP